MDLALDAPPKALVQAPEARVPDGGRPVFPTDGIPAVVACSC